MRILIIGGTGFIGPHVTRLLAVAGHDIAVFHRGRTTVPADILSVRGDRSDLRLHAEDFRRFDAEIVVDMIAYTARQAQDLVTTFRGIAQRLVVISSMDVYQSYGMLRGSEKGGSEPARGDEDAPLRQSLYPYRDQAKAPGDLFHDYEKILVERAAASASDLPATILRLPFVYGPDDPYRRACEYLKRMDDNRPAILISEAKANWRSTRGYVENIAAAIALAATNEQCAGRIYNVGESSARTETEWIQAISRIARWTGKIIPLPEERLPAHLRSHLDWRHDCAFATKRIRQDLGFEERVAFDEGLKRTVAWLRSNRTAPADSSQFDYPAEDIVLASLESPLD
jgi:nucleoside-diphosphate-sugar epimerase